MYRTQILSDICKESYSKNKFEKLVLLVGFVIRIYHDARSSKCQIFVSGLFNDFESSSDYLVLKEKMNKKCGRKHSWARTITDIFLKSMRNITKIFTQYILSPNCSSNLKPPAQEVKTIPHLRFS